MILVYAGLPGSGKSTMLARIGVEKLLKAQKIYKKTGLVRKVASNIRFSPHIEKKFLPFITYWQEAEEITKLEDCDILIDEIAIYFDAQNWSDTSMDVKRFLRLHRHYGVNIYGVAQDFDTVDVSFRRLVNELYQLQRVAGTSEPSKYNKQSKFPWVFSLLRTVERKDFMKPKEEYRYMGFDFTLFTRKDFMVFNTKEKFNLSNIVPFKHIIKHCAFPDCNHHQVVHR